MLKKFFCAPFLLATFYLLLATSPISAVWDPTKPNEPAEIKDVENIFSDVLGVIAGLAALACFVMLLIGGFKYLTSGGDPKATSSAKNTLTYAIIGLALLIIAWLILRFIHEFTGIDVTQFRIQYNP